MQRRFETAAAFFAGNSHNKKAVATQIKNMIYIVWKYDMIKDKNRSVYILTTFEQHTDIKLADSHIGPKMKHQEE